MSSSVSHMSVFHFQHQLWDIEMNWTRRLERDVLEQNPEVIKESKKSVCKYYQGLPSHFRLLYSSNFMLVFSFGK